MKNEYPDWRFDDGSLVGDSHVADNLGFVYIIESPSGMKYVGKKQFWSAIRRKPLKGKKVVRLDSRESDWKKYFGSSKDLVAELEKSGPEGWTRTVLHLCKSKWELMWYELKEQMGRDALLRSDYWNGIIHVRLSRPPKSFTNPCRVRRRK